MSFLLFTCLTRHKRKTGTFPVHTILIRNKVIKTQKIILNEEAGLVSLAASRAECTHQCLCSLLSVHLFLYFSTQNRAPLLIEGGIILKKGTKYECWNKTQVKLT